ncbi:MAG: hypothetical protein ACFFCS_09195 [Candidatus Hodarchaeota archaeon]
MERYFCTFSSSIATATLTTDRAPGSRYPASENSLSLMLSAEQIPTRSAPSASASCFISSSIFMSTTNLTPR